MLHFESSHFLINEPYPKKVKLLLVEDEKGLSSSIINYLKLDGYVCELAEDFQTAIEKVNLYEYDCALVDLNLPGGSGYDIVRQIKKLKKTIGIIIISARNQVNDRIKGLDLGADDYLVKPFELAELNARIKSLIRRINFKGDNEFTVGELTINPDEFTIICQGQPFELTKKEYNLLLFLAANKQRVITKETIAEHLWGDNIDMADSYDFVYSHIKNLRKKLQEKGLGKYIQTIYGIGYKFCAE